MKLLRMLLSVLLFILAVVPGCRCEEISPTTDRGTHGKSGVVERCPVCGLEFDRAEAVGKVSFEGKTYYFLLKDHLDEFRRRPSVYLEKN